MTARGWSDGRLAVRMAISWNLIEWALVLSRSGDVFATNHVYDHLARWGNEAQWVWLFGGSGIACAMGLFGSNRVLRIVGATAACTMQAAIAVSSGGGPQVGTGFGAYVGLAIASIWLVWRELASG